MSQSTSVFATSYPSGEYPGTVIQSPKINSSGEPTQRSIKNGEMGKDIVKLVIQAGRNRSIVASRILAKYNAERPYDAYKLEAEGLGWRSNMTTKPLPSMIEKVAPRLVSAVNGLKYLTNSELSNKWQNSVQKTEDFRKGFTNLIRNRKGWQTTLEDICFVNALFGFSTAGCLDEFTSIPTAFAFDEAFFPDGTKQRPQWVQVGVLKEALLPHELFARIKDSEVAKTLGYDLELTRQVINEATPQQVRDRLNVGGTLEFWYQNALRELTIGASYMAGNNVAVVYHLLAKEVTGKVSHYQYGGSEMAEIYAKEDKFDNMGDVIALFAYQKGNGTLHGSKGVGRDLYELAGMIDRNRNEIVDRAILSGKTLVQGDVKRIHTFKMSVIGATVIFPTGWEVLERKFDGNIEPFLKLDAYFSMLADQLIGNVSPPNPSQATGEGFRSPAAWNLMAAREEEGKDARISRFLEQFTDFIGMLQKRACSKDVTEDDAKEFQKEMLTKMTREEFDELAKCPVAGNIRDLTPMERQMIVAVVQEKKGNPLYKQRQMEVEDLTARVSTDFAERVLLPDNDPTVQAEQLREQQLELTLLQQGQAVPVSPRDNHMIHLGAIVPLAEQEAAQMMQGQSNTQIFEAVIAHITEHYNFAEQQGVPAEQLKEVAALVNKAGPIIAKLKEMDAQAAQLAQQSQAHDAEVGGQPPPPPEQ